jgi:hypothetical protein
MIHKVFTVYDAKTKAYLPPFHSHALGQAERSFTEACNDPSHEFSKYAEDFTLFYIADFDDEKAHYNMLKAPFSLGTAIQFKKVATGSDAIKNN